MLASVAGSRRSTIRRRPSTPSGPSSSLRRPGAPFSDRPALRFHSGHHKRALADKQARDETDHDPGHLLVNRISGTLETRRQRLELLLTLWALPLFGIEGRGDFSDLRDIPSDRRLLGRDLVHATVNAAG